MSFESALAKILDGESLSADDSRTAFDTIFSGTVPDDLLANFLLGLAKKGETVDEILGAAQSMRAKALTIEAPPNAVDIVGTGGDQLNTLNVSTAAALVVAACGVPVAKHGNRASSSRSGSSDVLRELGVNLEPDLAVLERCLAKANLCFLFAPRHHPAMRHVVAVRRGLGVRTIFNLLGPLTNPAKVQRHVIGVYDNLWLKPMAEILQRLGSDSAWVVCGQDGMDEITTTAPTDLTMLQDGIITTSRMTPEDFDMSRVDISALHGKDTVANAIALRRLLRGLGGPYRDIVLLNAGAALCVAGAAAEMRQGIHQAAHAIDSGAAYNTLDTIVRLTNESP